jgi:hypothetical protein
MQRSKFIAMGWHRNIKPASRYPVVFAGRNDHVAIVQRQGFTEEQIEAHCDLIATAPDMLALLCELVAAEDLAMVRDFKTGIKRVLNKAAGIYD